MFQKSVRFHWRNLTGSILLLPKNDPCTRSTGLERIGRLPLHSGFFKMPRITSGPQKNEIEHLPFDLASDLGGDRLSVDDARARHERSITLARPLGNGFFWRVSPEVPMDVLTALRTRRSIRAFKPDPV